MSRTFRQSAHTFKKINDNDNKNNANGVFKGDFKQDKQAGLKSFSLKKYKLMAEQKLKDEQVK